MFTYIPTSIYTSVYADNIFRCGPRPGTYIYMVVAAVDVTTPFRFSLFGANDGTEPIDLYLFPWTNLPPHWARGQSRP